MLLRALLNQAAHVVESAVEEAKRDDKERNNRGDDAAENEPFDPQHGYSKVVMGLCCSSKG